MWGLFHRWHNTTTTSHIPMCIHLLRLGVTIVDCGNSPVLLDVAPQKEHVHRSGLHREGSQKILSS